MITSLQNAKVKDAVRLRQSRARAKQGLTLIDGVREISRALDAGVCLVEAFVCPALCEAETRQGLLLRLQNAGASRVDVSPAVFEKVSFGSRAEGVVAVARPPRLTLDELSLPASALVAVLESIEKPGNVGAAARSADGSGVSAMLLADSADPFSPNAIRASLGTVFAMPICQAGAATIREWLRRRNLAVFAAVVDGAINYTAADFRQAAAIVLGSEAAGLSECWRGEDVTAVRIPMLGAADSLNVSATAAILFYEALRQRSSSHMTIEQ